MEPSLLKNLMVQFDLPFVVRVDDSIQRDTRPVGYQDYQAIVDDISMMLRFEKKLRDLGGVQFAIEDHRGLLNYSTVQIWFDHQLLHKLNVGSDFRMHREAVIQMAIAGLNQFLELYRYVTRSYWINPVRYNQIPLFLIVGIRPDGTDDPYSFSEYGTGLALGATISHEQDSQIRASLQSSWSPDDLQRFFLVCMDLLDKEEYWSATLSIEILFEAQFAAFLRSLFIKSGLSEKEADAKFETNGYPRSITNLITTYVREIAGIDIEHDANSLATAYREWSIKARDARNMIAHGRNFLVTRQQAIDAFSAVRHVLEELNKNLR